MLEGLLQPTHLILILVVGLIVFGPGKLGELGGQLGSGVREFRTNMEGSGSDPAARRFCPACGTAVDGGSRFCSSCGAQQT